MNLREPRKKGRVKLGYRSPFPIAFDQNKTWSVYTAHLTDLGSCVVDPNEIHAIHSMGFFGKGSLSRSFPSFGKTQHGAPAIIRHRQWLYRQEWLMQVKDFGMQSNSKDLDLEEIQFEEDDEQNDIPEETNSGSDVEKEPVSESEIECTLTPDIMEISESPSSTKKQQTEDACNEEKTDTDHEVLDSVEDADICIIQSKNNKEQENNSKDEGLSSENKVEDEELHTADSYQFNEKDLYILNGETDLESKLLVLPDSDSETEDYLKDIKPRIEWQSFPIQETLHLTNEETFFLSYGLGCLNVINFDGRVMNINNIWMYFCNRDKNFLQKYIVYHYFRSKGWVVKPGLKYGGDFLLYKQGPPFYHASYIVIVDVVDADTLTRIPNKCIQSMPWNGLLGLERLSETAAKVIR